MQYRGVKGGVIKLSPQPLSIKDGETFCMVFTEVDNVETSRHTIKYTFHTSPTTKVFFNEENLPSFLRLKFTMIQTLPPDLYSDSNTAVFEADCYIHNRYIGDYSEFKKIGWQVSPNIYVIVMNKDEMYKLENHDTREKS